MLLITAQVVACQLKAYHAHFHQHVTDLQADPDSLLQKIFTSQANAWQTGLAASMCLFKAALSGKGVKNRAI